MNKISNLYENMSELTDAELDAATGGATLECNGKGDCKVNFTAADVWNQFCFTANVPAAYIK